MEETTEVGTVTAQPEGSAETQGTAADVAVSSPDPNDFDARLRSDPDFAVRFAKEQQSAASRANTRLKQAELALQIAERLGGGDLSKGGEQALSELMLLRQMRDNPDMARMIERFQSGSPIAAPQSDQYSSTTGYEEPEDQRAKQIDSLQRTVAGLEQQIAVRGSVEAFKSFAETDYGKLLDKGELSEVFSAFEQQARAWANTPEGRQRLMKLSSDDVRTIALHHLDRTGKLLEIGERRAQQRTAALRSRETDGPSRINGNGAPVASKVSELRGDAAWLQALKEAKAELGL